MAGNKTLQKFKDSKIPKKGKGKIIIEIPIYEAPHTSSKIIGHIPKNKEITWISKSVCDEREWIRCNQDYSFGYIVGYEKEGKCNLDINTIKEKKEEIKIGNKPEIVPLTKEEINLGNEAWKEIWNDINEEEKNGYNDNNESKTNNSTENDENNKSDFIRLDDDKSKTSEINSNEEELDNWDGTFENDITKIDFFKAQNDKLINDIKCQINSNNNNNNIKNNKNNNKNKNNKSNNNNKNNKNNNSNNNNKNNNNNNSNNNNNYDDNNNNSDDDDDDNALSKAINSVMDEISKADKEKAEKEQKRKEKKKENEELCRKINEASKIKMKEIRKKKPDKDDKYKTNKQLKKEAKDEGHVLIDGKIYPMDFSSCPGDMNQAMRDAKRLNNVPENAEPKEVYANYGLDKKIQNGYVYVYEDIYGKMVVLRDDRDGHLYEGGYEIPPHINDLTEKKRHFFYNGEGNLHNLPRLNYNKVEGINVQKEN